MRRRAERALVIAVLVVAAGWASRPVLRSAGWALRGAWELARLPTPPPAPPIAAPVHIAHAGGAFGALRYTNSLEALDRNYARGVRWFELDFLPDPEGAWWAVHDWREVQELLGIAPFHVLTLDEALAWFARHGDARLVTDTKGDNAVLLQRLGQAPPGLRARIHPQIYRLSEYAPVVAGGFAAPIFTTYRSAYPWWVLRRFAQHAPLLAVTVTRAEAREACAALCGRIPLLTHTVNDPTEAAERMSAGISGIYTDDLLP